MSAPDFEVCRKCGGTMERTLVESTSPRCNSADAVLIEGTKKEVKYENIYSAIHNFGHSFLSLMKFTYKEFAKIKIL